MIFQAVGPLAGPPAPAVSPLIQGQDMVIPAESPGEIVPDAAVAQESVKKQHDRFVNSAPIDIMELQAIYVNPLFLGPVIFRHRSPGFGIVYRFCIIFQGRNPADKKGDILKNGLKQRKSSFQPISSQVHKIPRAGVVTGTRSGRLKQAAQRPFRYYCNYHNWIPFLQQRTIMPSIDIGSMQLSAIT